VGNFSHKNRAVDINDSVTESTILKWPVERLTKGRDFYVRYYERWNFNHSTPCSHRCYGVAVHQLAY